MPSIQGATSVTVRSTRGWRHTNVGWKNIEVQVRVGSWVRSGVSVGIMSGSSDNYHIARAIKHLASVGDDIRLRCGAQHPLQHLHNHLLIDLHLRHGHCMTTEEMVRGSAAYLSGRATMMTLQP